MGAVNAIATLAGCLPAVIWWACHRPNRRWWRYTAWWVPALALAMTWWLVALILMARISPPFLDFIESSGVTTQWSSLVEVLRGTDSWTPFVAPERDRGRISGHRIGRDPGDLLVAAAGLAGLGMRDRAGTGATGDHAAGRGGTAGRRIQRRARLTAFASRAGFPGRRRSAAAQRAQAGVGDPDPDRPGPGAGAGPDPATGDRAESRVDQRVCSPGARQAGRGRDRDLDRSDGRHFAGMDRSDHPARDVQRDTPVLARRRRLADPNTTPAAPTAGKGPGGSRRAVRHSTVGHQPRRTAAGSGRQPVGSTRLHPVDPAADHPSAGFGATPLRGRAGLPRVWPIRLPVKVFHTLSCATTWIPTPHARHARSWCTGPSRVRRDCRKSRSSARRSGPAQCRGSSPTAGCDPDIPPWRSTGSAQPAANTARPT